MTHQHRALHRPLPTNWHVITGAPCAGKTAVIDTLAQRGYRVAPEAARAYIDLNLSRGRTLAEMKADPLAFERHILKTKIKTEAALPQDDLIFLDRAIPDSIAYYQMEGLDPTEAIPASRKFRYKTVFLMERLRFESDRVRSESDNTAACLEGLLTETYTRLGYQPIRVPVLSIAQRTDFILEYLSIG